MWTSGIRIGWVQPLQASEEGDRGSKGGRGKEGGRAPGGQHQPITHAAVAAVLDTPQGLPRGFMRDDESEILGFLTNHNSTERDASVERACDLGTQLFSRT